MTPLHATLPTLLAAGSLDFDITMVIQFVVFSAAIFILNFLLFKPYLQAREARAEGTSGSREEADEMHARAGQLLASYEERLTEARREAIKLREERRGEGLSEQEELLSAVRREVAGKLTEGRGELSVMVNRAEADLGARAGQLAGLMIERVLPEVKA